MWVVEGATLPCLSERIRQALLGAHRGAAEMSRWGKHTLWGLMQGNRHNHQKSLDFPAQYRFCDGVSEGFDFKTNFRWLVVAVRLKMSRLSNAFTQYSTKIS